MAATSTPVCVAACLTTCLAMCLAVCVMPRAARADPPAGAAEIQGFSPAGTGAGIFEKKLTVITDRLYPDDLLNRNYHYSFAGG